MHIGDRLALARGIATRYGLRAAHITAIVGAGSVNSVFHVRATDEGEDAVIRFAVDGRRADETEVEDWALRAAARSGIPSPTVVRRGCYQGLPFLIESFVPGQPGAAQGGHELWRVLGEYARTISTIAVPPDAPGGLFTRFGSDLAAAWRAHVDYNIAGLDDDPLRRLGAYQQAQQGRLRDMLCSIRDPGWNYGLAHRDLHPRNLILRPVGPPVLIDWGTAQAGPAPWLDAAQVVRAHLVHEVPAADELEAFLSGCGVSTSSRPRLDSLVVLNGLDLVRWALDRRPDRVGELAAEARLLTSALCVP